MTALHTLEDLRTRGSTRLLAAWQLAGQTGDPAGPLDALAAELVVVDGERAADLWARALRQHGGRPLPPRAATDGVPHADLVLGAMRDRRLAGSSTGGSRLIGVGHA